MRKEIVNSDPFRKRSDIHAVMFSVQPNAIAVKIGLFSDDDRRVGSTHALKDGVFDGISFIEETRLPDAIW